MSTISGWTPVTAGEKKQTMQNWATVNNMCWPFWSNKKMRLSFGDCDPQVGIQIEW